jgi:hypothetical protein
MAARLQASTSSGKPVLLRVEYEGGHGGIGGTESKRGSLWPTNTRSCCGNSRRLIFSPNKIGSDAFDSLKSADAFVVLACSRSSVIIRYPAAHVKRRRV